MKTRKYSRARHANRGFVLMFVLAITATLLFVAMATVASSLFAVRGATLHQSKVAAQFLADAGVDDSIGQFASDTSFTGRTQTLYQDPPTNSIPFGRYTTTAASLTGGLYHLVTSVGTGEEGNASTVVAKVAVSGGNLGGSAAILANGPVTINGNPTVVTTPVNQHTANVWANGNISMGGSSAVDGQLVSAGTVNGAGYYPSESGAPKFSFPDTATTEEWKTSWIAQAQGGGTINGINKKSQTITAPAYVDGDINLTSSNSVTINGTGVVYVNGNVSMTARSKITNGGQLIVRGTFSQAGQSTYQVTSTNPAAILVVYGSGGSATSTTISLVGGSSSTPMGIIYSVLGNIDVTGNSTIVGALVAGGAGSGVSVHGTFNQYYPTNLSSTVIFPILASVQMVAEP